MVQLKGGVTAARIEYPSSDGTPLGETERHVVVTVDARHVLSEFFEDRPDVYVGMDLLMYWEEGNPSKSVAPDIFVVLGAPKRPRRDTWLVWAEGGLTPDFVLEVTSKTTRRVDEGKKRALYRKLGVGEYWQFDPTGDYLDPVLKGARLVEGVDRPIRPMVVGITGDLRFESDLGLHLLLEKGELRFVDAATGRVLLTGKEAAADRKRLKREAERLAQENAELRACLGP